MWASIEVGPEDLEMEEYDGTCLDASSKRDRPRPGAGLWTGLEQCAQG